MDPNLFHLDSGRTTEVLAAIVVLSFVIERALAIPFEHRLFIKYLDQTGIKAPIAFGLSFRVCWYWNFDAISMIVLSEQTTTLGAAITGAVIAGGSKASLKLFHDVLNVKSSAYRELKQGRPSGG